MAENQDAANPYTNNRIQYSSVLESAAANAKGWRIATFLSLIIAVAAVIGMVYVASKSKFIPVIIEIDGYGTPMRLYTINEETNTRDSRVTQAAIARVISTVRSVSSDASYQKKALNEIIFFFEKGSAAFTKIQEYLTGDTSPFTRAKSELVSVAINNVIKLTEQTWQAEWIETTRDRTGKVKLKNAYIATITIAQAENISQRMLYINPTGVLISDIHWNIRINTK